MRRDCTIKARDQTATAATLSAEERSAHAIFGSPDDMKFRSSMTLFSAAAEGEGGSLFRSALDRYFAGEPDERTLALLKG
ncbi:MAG: hypothetical protein B7Y95_07770 [Rhizobiales bacterium 32-66-11]|nr:MAG: hypothetical protein B7Y95_07770 [Rhizobiales bacterium 32-66-11]